MAHNEGFSVLNPVAPTQIEDKILKEAELERLRYIARLAMPAENTSPRMPDGQEEGAQSFLKQ